MWGLRMRISNKVLGETDAVVHTENTPPRRGNKIPGYPYGTGRERGGRREGKLQED